jgi:hypothetical protein
MIKEDIMKKIFTISIILLTTITCMAYAQDAAGTLPGAGTGRQKPPIFTAIDSNLDGSLSSTEISRASASLKTLDKNGDGKLTPDEYKPPKPGEMQRAKEGNSYQKQGESDNQALNDKTKRSLAQNNSFAPESTQASANQVTPDSVQRKGQKDGRPPKPSIDLALDANKDDVISASEIAGAALALKGLDKNIDGSLSRDECLPARPDKK